MKGIIAVEPALSPDYSRQQFRAAVLRHLDVADHVFPAGDRSAADRARSADAFPIGPDVTLCWLQAAPVRTLPTLKGIPILVIASQASSNSKKHYCVSRYLTQAGVANDYVPLASVGITGNAHMMMLEKNSDTIAAYFARWLATRNL